MMHDYAQAYIALSYLACIALGVGYSRLMIAKPRQHKVLFVLASLTITVALVAAFRLWGEAHVRQQYARVKVDEQLAGRPGLLALSQRHPEVRAGLERIALVQVTRGNPTDDELVAATADYAKATGKYEPPYLAIAADKELVTYAGALAATISHANDSSGSFCGGMLNGQMVPTVRAMNELSMEDFKAANDAALLSAFEHPHELLSAARFGELDAKLGEFLERRYGPLQARVLLNALAAPAPANDPELCRAQVLTIEYALALPSPDREDTIRTIFQANAMEPSDKETQPEASAPLNL